MMSMDRGWGAGDFPSRRPPGHARTKLTPQQRQEICRRWAKAQESDDPPVRWDFCKEVALEFHVSVHTINGLLP